MVKNFDVLGSESLFFLCTLLKVSRQGIGSFISLALTIIDLKVVTREVLSQVDLPKAQTLQVYELAEVVVVGEYEYLIHRAL